MKGQENESKSKRPDLSHPVCRGVSVRLLRDAGVLHPEAAGGDRMVGDYISREAALSARLERLPAADAVERKPGVWIWDDEGYHCSECFFHAYGCTEEILSGDYHFCPHCGASMQDGGHDD